MNLFPRLSDHLGLRNPESALLRHRAGDSGPAVGVSALAEAGFGGVFDNYLAIRSEAWVSELVEACAHHGMMMTSFVYDCEHWDTPAWINGNALKMLPRMLDLARTTGAAMAVCPCGSAADTDRAGQMRQLADNLHRAAEQGQPAGLTLGVEACHPDYAPGQLLRSLEEALSVVELANHPGVKLTLDIGHVVLLGGEPVAAIKRAADRIGQVQFADVPGRVEPGAGRLDWTAITSALLLRPLNMVTRHTELAGPGRKL